MNKHLRAYAFSLATIFTGASQAQTPQSTTVFTSEGLIRLTLQECYKLNEIDAALAEKRQQKTDLRGRFFGGQPAFLYANAETGSYTIVGVIEDDDALIKKSGDELIRLQQTGGIQEYQFACIVKAADEGYPDRVKDQPIYQKLFTPQ